MRGPFTEWFNREQAEYPELNLGAIKKILHKAYLHGFDLAYPRGYRQGYDDRDKMEPVEEKPQLGSVPLNPTPAMLDAGGRRLVDWDTASREQMEQSRVEAERIWRAMWSNY